IAADDVDVAAVGEDRVQPVDVSELAVDLLCGRVMPLFGFEVPGPVGGCDPADDERHPEQTTVAESLEDLLGLGCERVAAAVVAHAPGMLGGSDERARPQSLVCSFRPGDDILEPAASLRQMAAARPVEEPRGAGELQLEVDLPAVASPGE